MGVVIAWIFYIFSISKPLNYQTVSRRPRDRLRSRPFCLIGQSSTRSPLIGPLRFLPGPILGEEGYFVTHTKKRKIRGKFLQTHTPHWSKGEMCVLHFAQLGTYLNIKGTVSERNFENVKGTVSRVQYFALKHEVLPDRELLVLWPFSCSLLLGSFRKLFLLEWNYLSVRMECDFAFTNNFNVAFNHTIYSVYLKYQESSRICGFFTL